MTRRVVIVGAGHAAGQCIASLRQGGFQGSLTLLGEERWLPYQRPPLSKKYLAGELDAERLHFKPRNFYTGVDVRLETRVTGIDRGVSTVHTASGEAIEYDDLVIATGSRPRLLPVAGASLDGVYYLRGIDDVNAIREEFTRGRKIVIVGAGYIGLEVAGVACQAGLAVTVLEAADRVMSRVVAPAVSRFYATQHERRGVELLLSVGATAICGNGHVTHIELDNGDRIEADLIVIGIGVQPNIELAADAGLDVDDGIIVDDRCVTSDASIYSIGDCTKHPNAILDRMIRLESVQNALEQAKTAAANICGQRQSYREVPWFWSDQYDLKLQIAGISMGYDQTVIRGNPEEGSFACCYLESGRLIAVDAVNRPRDFMQAKPLIANRVHVDAARLADTGVMLQDLAGG